MSGVYSRSQPLLGTFVTLQIARAQDGCALDRASDEMFALIAHIGTVMSAHDPASDLGRMSRARDQDVLTLDPHTVHVLRAAQYWTRKSGGAFHPVQAGRVLAARGVRPGLQAQAVGLDGLADVHILSNHQVRMPFALSLDLGGIAKGYAVDQAARCLMQQGVTDAIINAGGDVRVVGSQAWSIDVRHAGQHLRDRVVMRGKRLAHGALATSAADSQESQFVPTTAGRGRLWRSATVQARDCMTADVLTKWALQSSLLCPSLKSAMREHHARMWRS